MAYDNYDDEQPIVMGKKPPAAIAELQARRDVQLTQLPSLLAKAEKARITQGPESHEYALDCLAVNNARAEAIAAGIICNLYNADHSGYYLEGIQRMANIPGSPRAGVLNWLDRNPSAMHEVAMAVDAVESIDNRELERDIDRTCGFRPSRREMAQCLVVAPYVLGISGAARGYMKAEPDARRSRTVLGAAEGGAAGYAVQFVGKSIATHAATHYLRNSEFEEVAQLIASMDLGDAVKVDQKMNDRWARQQKREGNEPINHAKENVDAVRPGMEAIVEQTGSRGLAEGWKLFSGYFENAYDEKMSGMPVKAHFGQAMRQLQAFHDQLDEFAGKYPGYVDPAVLKDMKEKLDEVESALIAYVGTSRILGVHGTDEKNRMTR